VRALSRIQAEINLINDKVRTYEQSGSFVTLLRELRNKDGRSLGAIATDMRLSEDELQGLLDGSIPPQHHHYGMAANVWGLAEEGWRAYFPDSVPSSADPKDASL